MVTMNVSLPEPMKAWIEAQVQSGRFANTSDYVRDLIRQEQHYQQQRQVVLQALIEGEQSADADYCIEALIEELDAEESAE